MSSLHDYLLVAPKEREGWLKSHPLAFVGNGPVVGYRLCEEFDKVLFCHVQTTWSTKDFEELLKAMVLSTCPGSVKAAAKALHGRTEAVNDVLEEACNTRRFDVFRKLFFTSSQDEHVKKCFYGNALQELAKLTVEDKPHKVERLENLVARVAQQDDTMEQTLFRLAERLVPARRMVAVGYVERVVVKVQREQLYHVAMDSVSDAKNQHHVFVKRKL